jgi:hypothetical protein
MKIFHRGLVRSVLCGLLMAATIVAQDPNANSTPPPTRPAPVFTPRPTHKNHRIRTVLLVVAAVAIAGAGAAVAVLHKSGAPQHCNGPNPNVCSPPWPN